MPAPFGFGVGDFLAVAELAQKIAVALNDTRGASTEYTSLVALLNSISDTIHTITRFLSSSATCVDLKVDEAFMNGIRFHVDACQRLMNSFMTNSKKYTEALFNGKGSKAKLAFKKISWFMCRSEDVLKLEQLLQGHVNAFQSYLTAVNIQTQVQSVTRVTQQLRKMDHTLGEVHNFVQISHENRPKMLGYAWEGVDPTAHINFEDALGRKLVLPAILCRSREVFCDTLKIMFLDHPGYAKVLRAEYEILDAVTGIELISRTAGVHPWMVRANSRANYHWNKRVYPGVKLVMNVIQERQIPAPRGKLLPTVPKALNCSRCGWENFGSGYRTCQNCNTHFRYTVLETEDEYHPEPGSWPKIVFSSRDPQSQLIEVLSPESKNNISISSSHRRDQGTIRVISSLEYASKTVQMLADEEKYFRRIHHVFKSEIPTYHNVYDFESSRVPIIQAAGQGHARWVQELLLESDVDTNGRSSTRRTALQQACFTKIGRPEATVKLLLKHGADVNAAASPGTYTALQAACLVNNKEIVEMLLKHRADVNAPVASGTHTPLQTACKVENIEMVELLLKHGADFNAPASPGISTALQEACILNNKELVELLLKHGAGVNTPAAPVNHTALQAACLAGNKDILKLLFQHRLHNEEISERYLWEAALTGGSEEIIDILLQHGALANEQCRNLSGSFLSACGQKIGITATVDLVLQHGTLIKNRRAIAVAVEYGHEDIVKWLVESDADVDAMIQVNDYTDKLPFGRVFMARSLLSYAHSISMIKLLVSNGASPDWGITEEEGISAVQYAAGCQSIEILEELIGLGGDVHAPAAALMGRTALQEACGSGSLEKVKLLVEKNGANVNEPRAKRIGGVTSLEQAVCYAARKSVLDEPGGEKSMGNKLGMVDMEDHETTIKSSAAGRSRLELKEIRSSMDIVKYLLHQGAAITPIMLHYAAGFGNWRLAELLLSEGADPCQTGYVDNYYFRLQKGLGTTVLETARLNYKNEFADRLAEWMHEHLEENS